MFDVEAGALSKGLIQLADLRYFSTEAIWGVWGELPAELAWFLDPPHSIQHVNPTAHLRLKDVKN